MGPGQTAVSFELLERRVRRGDAFALGSIAIHMLRTNRAADGTPDPRAVAIMIGAAAAGCQRCSRIVIVYAGGDWPGWSLTAEPSSRPDPIEARRAPRHEGRAVREHDERRVAMAVPADGCGGSLELLDLVRREVLARAKLGVSASARHRFTVARPRFMRSAERQYSCGHTSLHHSVVDWPTERRARAAGRLRSASPSGMLGATWGR